MKVWVLSLCLMTSVVGQARSYSSIRHVNFHHFIYPWPKDLISASNPKRTFKLQNGFLPITRDSRGDINGGAGLEKIVYGDVTGDSEEEAMIYVSLVSGGSGIYGIFYVYGLQDGRPKLLWHFATGDRADGGFHNAYASKGCLVVEIFSPIENRGACCPAFYTKNTYRWAHGKFRQQETKLLPNQ